MTFNVREPESSGDFKPAPAGTHPAVCCQLIDIGTQTREWSGETKQQKRVVLGFELSGTENPDFENKPYLVWQEYTQSLHEKAKLRKDLQAWRGRAFTAEELAAFDLEAVVGAPCMLNVVHSECGKWANISAIMALPKGTPRPDTVNDTRVFIIDEYMDYNQRALDVWETFSDHMKGKIKGSEEMKLHGNTHAQAVTGGHVPISAEDIPFAHGMPNYE